MLKSLIVGLVMLASSAAFADESFMGFKLGQSAVGAEKNAGTRGYSWKLETNAKGIVNYMASKGESSGKLDFFILSFIDNKLYLCEYVFSPEQYERISRAMLEKYGEPTQSYQKTARSSSVSMPSLISAWMTSTSTLVLIERNLEGGTFSSVKLTNNDHYRAASKRVPSNDPKL